MPQDRERRKAHQPPGVPFVPGERVRISPAHHWAQGALGTIVAMDGWPRTIDGRHGPILFYWVVLDQPQVDADGDGPYHSAEFDAAYLERSDLWTGPANMTAVLHALMHSLYPVGTALGTLLVPAGLLAVAVQPGPDCAAGTAYPWAWFAFVIAVLVAVSFTVAAWFMPGWRQRHLHWGASVGLALLAMLVLFVYGGLEYRAGLPC